MSKDSKVELSPEEAFVERVETLIRHQERVKMACELLGKKFIDKGESDFGLNLISDGRIHDNSKWLGIEREGFLYGNKDILKEAIEHHRSINPHHVKYWNGIEHVPRRYLAELVCDLYARSQEFGTDLREYIRDEFMPNHKITAGSRVCRSIKEFVDMLLEKPFSTL